MNDPVGAPGIGGSLGQCALCGGNFLYEILMGKSVKSITASGCNQTLFAHDACITKYADRKLDCENLPASSPLRQAYERAQRERSPQPAINATP
jgi:hypothetical protein